MGKNGGAGLNNSFKIDEIPKRFQNKLSKDIEYLVHRGIPGLLQICLFGSVARGDYKWNSDLDLAVITENPVTDHSLRGEIIDVLDMDLEGVSSDVVFRTLRNRSISNTFDKAFERDKVIVWER